MAAADPIPMSRVVVRIYETAGLDPDVKLAALATASGALAPASVETAWKQCPPAESVPPCDGPPAGEFVMRIVRLAAARATRPLRLADALVDANARSAVLATVYVDRIATVAHAAGMPVHTLLGYAMAHELGHLLLASNAHSTRGLMRAIWREGELRGGQEADWSFSAQDVAAIRARVNVTQRIRRTRLVIH